MRVLLVLLLALGLFGCGKPPANGVLVLTYASPYPATHTFSRADIEWMRYIEAQSKGRIRIKPYWGGALLSSNENMLEIRHGVADIGMITPMYARSAHLQRSQPSFYSGVTSIADQISVYRCLAAEYPAFDSEVLGVHVLAVQGGGFPGILTRNRPIRSLEDLRGLRLRAQEDTAAVLEALGADPVNMSMAEVYPAMAKGVIDGVVAPTDALKSMHLAEVGRFYSTIRIPRGAYPARAMGQAVWAKLSPEDQAIFTRGEAVWEAAMITGLEKAGDAGLTYAREAGVEVIAAPVESQDRFDALYRDNAMRLARRLDRFGIAGEAIAARAAQLIAQRRAGAVLTCGGGQ
ncbi:MAG: TRAP transporter substrate-binding protein DctP [Pseudomonadota bacterium]